MAWAGSSTQTGTATRWDLPQSGEEPLPAIFKGNRMADASGKYLTSLRLLLSLLTGPVEARKAARAGPLSMEKQERV